MAPTFHGWPWGHVADNLATEADEAHGFTPHHDQHVRPFRESSTRELMPFKPHVSCEPHATH